MPETCTSTTHLLGPLTDRPEHAGRLDDLERPLRHDTMPGLGTDTCRTALAHGMVFVHGMVPIALLSANQSHLLALQHGLLAGDHEHGEGAQVGVRSGRRQVGGACIRQRTQVG